MLRNLYRTYPVFGRASVRRRQGTGGASTPDEKDLYQAQCDLFLDPHDPAVIEQARKDGLTEEWIEAAQNSPVYKQPLNISWPFRSIRSTGRADGLVRTAAQSDHELF